jgi:hypothetical protein
MTIRLSDRQRRSLAICARIKAVTPWRCDGPRGEGVDTDNSRLVTRQETRQNREASACMGWKSHAMEVGVVLLAEDLAGLHEKCLWQ